MFFSYQHHIEETVQDKGKLAQFWQKWHRDKKLIVPYYSTSDTTSHTMLKLLADLTSRSPSYKACEGSIIRLAFGEKLDIVRRAIPGFNDEEAEALPRAEKLEFLELLKKYSISLNDIRETTVQCQKSWWQSGNAWMRIRLAQVDDVWVVTFKAIHYQNIALLNTKPTEDQLAIIVKSWDEDDWLQRSEPPVLVKVSTLDDPMGFKWTERDGGTVFDTVLHLKNKNDKSDIYGRPDILAVMEWMLAEIGYADLSAKGNNGDLVSKILLLMKEEPQETEPGGKSGADRKSGFTNKLHAVRQVTTTEGTHSDVKNVAGMTYYEEAPTVVKLDVNRDAGWYKQNSADASSKIYEVMNWAKELTGNSQANAGIGANVMIPLYMVFNEMTTEPLQVAWEERWGQIFDAVFGVVGESAQSNYNIKFQDKVVSLIEKLQEAAKSNTPQVAVGNVEEAQGDEAQQQTDEEDGNQDTTI